MSLQTLSAPLVVIATAKVVRRHTVRLGRSRRLAFNWTIDRQLPALHCNSVEFHRRRYTGISNADLCQPDKLTNFINAKNVCPA